MNPLKSFQSGLDRSRLPDPREYFESQGLRLIGRGPWRTTRCEFHRGSDSMRLNVKTGGWVCMAGCGAKGGDVLAYHMASQGLGFIDAAIELGAWAEDGAPGPTRAKQLSARDALSSLSDEANLVAVAAANVAHGVKLSADDITRLMGAARRIQVVQGCMR